MDLTPAIMIPFATLLLRCSIPLLALTAGCGAAVEPLPPGGHHVLFVGNSLTYTNDLPATFAAIARSAGDTFYVASATGPNLALIDHLTGSTDAEARIKQGGWEYVVLQQGPTTVPLCRDSLVLWTQMFDERIRKVGGVPALFMTWPDAGRPTAFDLVRLSFQTAAAAVDGVFLPAGEAWLSAWQEDPSLPLYGPDGFHPSAMGTFLAALEIYERLSGRDVRTLPAEAYLGSSRLSLPEATIRLLQRAAHDANVRFPARGQPAPTKVKAPTATSC